jgi:hypothetical protein
MGHKLVEHVEPRHLVENLDEAGPGIALIATKKRPASYSIPWRLARREAPAKFGLMALAT